MDLLGKEGGRSRSWRRFFLVLAVWFASVFVGSFLPLGGWSDVRSHWRSAALLTVICALFLMVSAYLYWHGGFLSGLQASLLCFVFGCMFVLGAQELYTDMLFFRELRSRHASTNQQAPNYRTAPNPAIAPADKSSVTGARSVTRNRSALPGIACSARSTPMKVIEDKVTVYPPHAICKADIPIILSAVPSEWTTGLSSVRLCSAQKENPHFVAALHSSNRSLTVKSRGVSKERTLRAVLTELAAHALGVTFLGGRRLQRRDQSRIERLVRPLVGEILPQLSKKKVWLDE
jgi:hypothetical protein